MCQRVDAKTWGTSRLSPSRPRLPLFPLEGVPGTAGRREQAHYSRGLELEPGEFWRWPLMAEEKIPR